MDALILHNPKEAYQLTQLWARANDKMIAMQKEDCCSVPAEFETLILFIGELRRRPDA